MDFLLKLQKKMGGDNRYRLNRILRFFGLTLLYTHNNVKETEQFHINRNKILKKEYNNLMDKYKKIINKYEKNTKKSEKKQRIQKQKLYKWSQRVKNVGKCDICNSTENLTAHHLWDKGHHPTLMFQDENGVCLCEKCHQEFHKIYSRSQVTPKMYEKFKIKKRGELILQGKL